MAAMAQDSAQDGPPELTDEQLEFLNSMFDLARAGRAEELLSLIDQGIPVNLTNSKGDSLLILAAYNDQPPWSAACWSAAPTSTA